jgi:hypothetical protein
MLTSLRAERLSSRLNPRGDPRLPRLAAAFNWLAAARPDPYLPTLNAICSVVREDAARAATPRLICSVVRENAKCVAAM